jgi:hypothetical protein
MDGKLSEHGAQNVSVENVRLGRFLGQSFSPYATDSAVISVDPWNVQKPVYNHPLPGSVGSRPDAGTLPGNIMGSYCVGLFGRTHRRGGKILRSSLEQDVN